ncbi:esterase-like activity of phytase family protein [Aquirhabdus parva]|uniref:esterase-like activity of phytase family protein n=1 Tax=Aquirhabdus parva TaxID=2283318 RepID=UPI001D183197|nr:esterase-like activity of phytase family protein [Aquirhabdus parva]
MLKYNFLLEKQEISLLKTTLLSAFIFALTTLTGCDGEDDISSVAKDPISTPTLTGFASLAAATSAEGPISGQFLGGTLFNGEKAPFAQQPVQGFSGAIKNPDGTYTVLADNGYGTLQNSADFLLRLYIIQTNLRTATGGSGSLNVLRHIRLRDPNKRIPFAIVNHFTSDRLLTGADFDPESIQRAPDGTFWIGDEFGPFLLHFSADGILLDAPFALPDPTHEGEILRSPQNPYSEESSALRIMNAVTAHAKAHGAKFTPVFSPDASLLKFSFKDAAGNTITSSSDAHGARGKNTPAGMVVANSDIFDVTQIRAAGYGIVPYTVNKESDMQKLLKAGVTGIISDRADLLYKAVSEFDANGDGKAGDYLLADGRIDPAKFDAQGHRGSRNLRPENTLPAFEAGLDNLMNTLETDNGITKDGVPIIKHDPYIDSVKCRHADGSPYTVTNEVLIKSLTQAQIQSQFICDLNPGRGATQLNELSLSPVAVQFATSKGYISPYVMPTTQDLFDFVNAYVAYYELGAGKSDPKAAVRVANAKTVRFNIETKLNPRSDKDYKGNIYKDRTVGFEQMTDALAHVIIKNHMENRADIQSFDFRSLIRTQELYPQIPTVYLWGDSVRMNNGLGTDGDGGNLQDEDGKNTPWLAGLSWPYRVTALSVPQRVQSSGGFEGMAISPDGQFLYPSLEKPLVDSPARENIISQFNIHKKTTTGNFYRFPLDSTLSATPAVSISDFQLFSATDGVVIEHDLKTGKDAGYKKIIRIHLEKSGDLVSKSPVIDLLNIANPHNLYGPTRSGDIGTGNPFSFPFNTVEIVVIENDRELTLMDDNNYPFSNSRNPALPDNDEVIRVRLPQALVLK